MRLPSVGPAGALLFVHRSTDLPLAICTVNALLAHRQSATCIGHRVLGILVGVDPDRAPLDLAGASDGYRVMLRESVGLSGIWSLCWFDSGLRESHDAGGQRRRLLDRVIAGGPSLRAGGTASGRRMLFPVLTRSEARGATRSLTDSLGTRYPTLGVGPLTFLHDPARGGIVRLDAGEDTTG